MRAFREAVEAGDIERGIGLLADDVTFRSPAVFTPYEGKEAVSQILRNVFEVFEDFRYVDELEGEATSGLVFRARVGDKELEGWDYLRTGDDGKIAEFTVMVRPASGLIALSEAMGARLAAQSS